MTTTPIKKLVLIGTLLLVSSAGAIHAAEPAASPANQRIITIGSTDNSLSPMERSAVRDTFLYLSAKLPQYKFVYRSYPASELEKAVKQGELDLFLASSGFYRRVYHRGLRDIVTMTTKFAEDPNYASGSLFLVAKDSNIRTIADLKGKTAAVSWHEGFTGYFVPLLAVSESGVDPDRFFGGLHVGGSPMRRLLEAVEAGKADVALARACTLEELINDEPDYAARFRPIGLRDEAVPGFHCLRSTPLLPNWTIVSTSSAPWQVSRDVTFALLSMPPLANGTSWAVVSDFARVDDLYRTLRRGPFEYLRIRSVSDFFNAYWPAFLAALLLVFGLALHSWRTAVLIRRRTKELRDAMEKEELARAAAEEERRQKEVLERVSVIGAMSSLITHELNAPLNAIGNSVRSLERFYEYDPPAPIVLKVLDLIRRQCEHAAAIVQHVRTYAKRREIVLIPVDMKAVAASVAADQQMTHPAVAIKTALPANPVTVAADPLEMELCVTNLVKNAIDAVQDQPVREVEVSLSRDAGHAVLSVTDHGTGTREDAETLFSRRLRSSKSNGLGLGLMIVRTIVERTSGSIEAQFADPGLRLILRIPLLKEHSNHDCR